MKPTYVELVIRTEQLANELELANDKLAAVQELARDLGEWSLSALVPADDDYMRGSRKQAYYDARALLEIVDGEE